MTYPRVSYVMYNIKAILFFPKKVLLLLVKAMYLGEYTTHILHANLRGEKGKQHLQRKQRKYS